MTSESMLSKELSVMRPAARRVCGSSAVTSTDGTPRQERYSGRPVGNNVAEAL